MSSMKSINKAIATAKAVAKKSTGVVAAALPIATVVANTFAVVNAHPGNPEAMFNDFIERYTSVNIQTGEIRVDKFMMGGGALIAAGIAGTLIKWLS